MNIRSPRAMAVTVAALTAAAGLAAAPAHAATATATATATAHYSYSDPTSSQVLPCGAVWTYGGEHRGTITKTDSTGGYLRIVQHDYYPGTITYQGRTYRADDHQTDITTLSDDGTAIGALSGQGLFTRIPGIGVVVSDTGHLVFDESTQQTISRSAKAIPLDQDFDYGTAVCAALAQ